jgi:hypothetical protein
MREAPAMKGVPNRSGQFSFLVLKDRRASVRWLGREVAILKGRDFDALLEVDARGDAAELQLFLARKTGNFKRGNERKD